MATAAVPHQQTLSNHSATRYITISVLIMFLTVCIVELSGQSEAMMPSVLVSLWQPLLYLMNKLHLTAQLLDSLSVRITEDGDLADCLSAGWIARILTAISQSGI